MVRGHICGLQKTRARCFPPSRKQAGHAMNPFGVRDSAKSQLYHEAVAALWLLKSLLLQLENGNSEAQRPKATGGLGEKRHLRILRTAPLCGECWTDIVLLQGSPVLLPELKTASHLIGNKSKLLSFRPPVDFNSGKILLGRISGKSC